MSLITLELDARLDCKTRNRILNQRRSWVVLDKKLESLRLQATRECSEAGFVLVRIDGPVLKRLDLPFRTLNQRAVDLIGVRVIWSSTTHHREKASDQQHQPGCPTGFLADVTFANQVASVSKIAAGGLANLWPPLTMFDLVCWTYPLVEYVHWVQ